jgi:hypothetical protein
VNAALERVPVRLGFGAVGVIAAVVLVLVLQAVVLSAVGQALPIHDEKHRNRRANCGDPPGDHARGEEAGNVLVRQHDQVREVRPR